MQPDRYINDHLTSAESANLVDPYERNHWMFGAGYVAIPFRAPSSTSHLFTNSNFTSSRRICPGMIVAEREIWLAISRMLLAFDMSELPGEPIDLKEYDGLSGRSPVPFRIMITPRHAKVEEVLRAASV